STKPSTKSKANPPKRSPRPQNKPHPQRTTPLLPLAPASSLPATDPASSTFSKIWACPTAQSAQSSCTPSTTPTKSSFTLAYAHQPSAKPPCHPEPARVLASGARDLLFVSFIGLFGASLQRVRPVQRIPLRRNKSRIRNNPSQLILIRAISHTRCVHHVLFN